MIVRDEQQNYVGLKCDKCDVMAPSAAEILRGHGLINLGWYCAGGTHICPAHPHPEGARGSLQP